MERTKLYLIILLISGFLLRLKAALNLDVLADDMLYASQSAGIIKAGILSTHSNPPLFFYLTDFTYNIIGYSTLASRFWPLIAGTLLIATSYLITDFLFNNKKIALCSAFFVSFSTFLIRMTFTEHTLLLLFFSSLGILFGLRFIRSDKKQWVYLSGLSFGLAILTKYSAPFFIIAFALFAGYWYERNNKSFNKNNLKSVLVFIIILTISALPFLAFNYFIYQDKGIVDVYFSRIIHIEKTQQIYQGLAGQGESFFERLTTLSSYSQYKLPFITDPILTLFAIAGIYLMFRKKEIYTLVFLSIMILVPFILQSGGSGLQKHFAFMHFFLAIPAGLALKELYDKLANRNRIKNIIYIILIILLLISIGTVYGTPDNFSKKSATSELKSYINEKVKPGDLVILDSRIYSARSFWLASPNSFLLSAQFPQIYESIKNLPSSNLKPTDVFFIECAIDDCGWGWVQNNQELNQSSEQISKIFEDNGILVKSISASEHRSQEYLKTAKESNIYRVHYLSLNLPPELLTQAKEIQSFYFTPYLYENRNDYLFDYKTSGLGSFLESVSLWIIYTAMILSAILLISVIWKIAKDRY